MIEKIARAIWNRSGTRLTKWEELGSHPRKTQILADAKAALDCIADELDKKALHKGADAVLARMAAGKMELSKLPTELASAAIRAYLSALKHQQKQIEESK